MDPNVVHRQFLPGYGDPATWSSILYNYGGQGPANQLHDLRAEQPRALPHDSQRQQITGHDIAEFFARTAAPPVTILNECHLQAQPQAQQSVTTAPHDVVLDLGLNTVIAPKKTEKVEPTFIQDTSERLRFDKRRLKTLKATLSGWYKRSGCVTVALTYLDGQVHISGPDHMLSLNGNEEFKNIFVNALTSYDQLSRLAEIVSNCNEEDNVAGPIDAGTVEATELQSQPMVDENGSQPTYEDFSKPNAKQRQRRATGEQVVLDQDCKICPQKFSSKHFLKKHMFEAHNQAPPLLICPFCNKRFMTRWKLERHTISHTGAKPYNCIYCPKRFAEKNKLVVHVKNHKEGFVDPSAVERLVNSLLPKKKTLHECLVCKKTFLSSWKLNRHIRVHSGEKPFKCSKCSKSFVEKSKLDQHELLPHDGTKVKHNQEKRHGCDKCDKKFVSLWKLKRHELFHSGERPWQCDRCGKGFVENNKLMLHMKFYHADKETPDGAAKRLVRSKKYECTDCNKKFATQWKLKRHSQTHSLDRPFRCELCKRGFLTKNKLDLHNFTLHSEEGQESQEKNTMTEKTQTAEDIVQQPASELREETGEHGSELNLPGLAITNDTSSAFVEELNHGFAAENVPPTNEKVTLTVTDPSAINANVDFNLAADGLSKLVDDPKTCGVCGKSFKTPSRLKRHMAIHTGIRPFKCTLCDKGFTERNKLLGHLKGHGVDNPESAIDQIALKVDGNEQQLSGKHQCTYCERCFVSPWKLKRHLTVHTGNKPFFCKICQRAFTEKNKLENHFRSNHPEDVTLLEEELTQSQVSMVEQESAFSIIARTVDERLTVKQEIISKDDPESSAKIKPDQEVEAKCDVCSHVFSSNEELSNHIQLMHSDVRSSEAGGLVAPNQNQMDTKKPLKYSCQVCGKSFITPSKLKRHSFSHGEQKPFKCKKCGKRFSENNKLFNHLLTHDKAKPEKYAQKIKIKVEKVKESKSDGADTVKCISNARTKDSVIVMKSSAMSENSGTAATVTQSVKSNSYPAEIVNPSSKEASNVNSTAYLQGLRPVGYSEPQQNMPVVPTAQDVNRSNSEQLKMLVENVLGSAGNEREDAVHASKIMNESSTTVSVVETGSSASVSTFHSSDPVKLTPVTSVLNLDTQRGSTSSVAKNQGPSGHGDSQATKAQPSKMAAQLYSCDVCHQAFLSAFSLKQHKIVNHSEKSIEEELKHRCTICNKGFNAPSKLKRHMLSHSNETPFHCYLCPKKFKRNDTLRKHIEEHGRATTHDQ